MKVSQSVFGKFHHFHLARHLHQNDLLEVIHSTYPEWKLRDQGIPKDKINSFPWIHLAWMANCRYGKRHGRVDLQLARWVATTFDAHVARQKLECDVLVAISGSGLKSGAVAQANGAKYICDRGSSHMRYQNRILTEEFAIWGQEYPGIDPFHIAREEKEYEQADAISVPSEFVRRSFIEMGLQPAKVKKIPYGADLSRFSKTGEPKEHEFQVLFAGQVSFRKGVPYLLEAFKQFKHPRKRLKIVGSVQAEMKSYLQDKHLEDVEFIGQVPYTQLRDIMSQSHVMVLPSIEEGMAMVQGEAMACGCPLICSENTGADDLFTNGQEGFIVPIRDPAAIGVSLEQLAEEPDLRSEMSANALKRVASIGGWDAYGRGYVRELEALVEGKQVTSVAAV